MDKRVRILVRGVVQGVGFRPFVFLLARKCSLRGRVLNNAAGVLIEIEGHRSAIQQLIDEIRVNPPPLSRIEAIEFSEDLEPLNYSDFRIAESTADGDHMTPISPDVSTCDDCIRELFDPEDRRFRYPFINCTNCGPRFTIIEDIPYDRARTTMREFEMCTECLAEYEDPLNRRFHAEPIACHLCGPQLLLSEPSALAGGSTLNNNPPTNAGGCYKTVGTARDLLLCGKVLAIKGIGGFHLACDAFNQEAVEQLRRRKYREDKPFAMMAASVAVIREHCEVSKAEEQLLLSEPRPIVLLERKPGSIIPQAVAPGVKNLGFMLPYSPLHHLLLENLDRPLVMTSGNVSDEPICFDDEQAVSRLAKIADYFLLHDRRIHMRTDDSLTRVHDGREMILRRSRGYAPQPLRTAFKFEQQILACGAELKNTFCITRGNHAFMSHHIGDLENLETLQSFTQGIEHFKALFHLQPEAIAYDLHPEYLSTKYALSQDHASVKIGVQHHHAHVASCMADNEIEGEVIGVAMDGLGFGTDGLMWGGEFFVANFLEAERIAHLEYLPMPGGAKAVREPWRMAAVSLQRALGDEFEKLNLPFVRNMDATAWATLRRMIATGTNSPGTSSMGRLFDAMASLLGLRARNNYEGQAAIELEAIADPRCIAWYEFEVGPEGSSISAAGVIRKSVEDIVSGVPPPSVSAKFHLGVAHLIASVARRTRAERRLNRVVLSGGVFQNMLLLRNVCGILKSNEFEVFTHSRVPTNDGGISLGQAAIANARLSAGRV